MLILIENYKIYRYQLNTHNVPGIEISSTDLLSNSGVRLNLQISNVMISRPPNLLIPFQVTSRTLSTFSPSSPILSVQKKCICLSLIILSGGSKMLLERALWNDHVTSTWGLSTTACFNSWLSWEQKQTLPPSWASDCCSSCKPDYHLQRDILCHNHLNNPFPNTWLTKTEIINVPFLSC